MLFPLTRIVTALARGLLLFALTVATQLLAAQPTVTELQDKLAPLVTGLLAGK